MSEKIATREAYGKALVELGAVNDKVVVLDADLAGATMTKFFKAAYPDRFNVKICCSHAGVSVGEDGGSHQSVEDIGLMRLIPGMTVIVPADAREARKATFALAEFKGPAYMRLARLATPVFEEDYPFEIGKANVLREGKDVAVFACGLMVSETLEAARLLAETSVPVNQISLMVGFQTSRYFSQCFRQMFGMTPTEYRSGKSLELRV